MGWSWSWWREHASNVHTAELGAMLLVSIVGLLIFILSFVFYGRVASFVEENQHCLVDVMSSGDAASTSVASDTTVPCVAAFNDKFLSVAALIQGVSLTAAVCIVLASACGIIAALCVNQRTHLFFIVLASVAIAVTLLSLICPFTIASLFETLSCNDDYIGEEGAPVWRFCTEVIPVQWTIVAFMIIGVVGLFAAGVCACWLVSRTKEREIDNKVVVVTVGHSHGGYGGRPHGYRSNSRGHGYGVQGGTTSAHSTLSPRYGRSGGSTRRSQPGSYVRPHKTSSQSQWEPPP